MSTPTIRSNLRQLADSRNVSIRKVAQDIGYRFESVRSMYNNEMERYPRDLLAKLCVYFNVGISDLLALVDEPTPHVANSDALDESGC